MHTVFAWPSELDRDVPAAARVRIDAVVAVLLPVLILGVLGWSHRWISDDGLINVRVVRQLVAGHGPVFNVGERVEVGTSALWIYLLAALRVVVPADVGRLAVWSGLVLSMVGIALVQLASLLPLRPLRARTLVVPLGGLVIAALPPFWDFATSGLETGLTFAWLGASVFGLTVVARRPEDRGPALAVAAVAGLGPLVRPDLGVIAICFLGGLFVLRAGEGARDLLVLAVAAAALPVAYEVFRMGYYGLPVPTPALTKEASRPNFTQGWRYLSDLVGTYWLFIPLLAIASIVRVRWQANTSDHQRQLLVPLVTLIIGAVLHAGYVMYAGGDFMSGRLLLPSVFCLAATVGVVRLGWPEIKDRRSLTAWSAIGAVMVWALIAAFGLRLPYRHVGPHGIADERNFYRYVTYTDHPVAATDYRKSILGAWGELGAGVAASGRRQLCVVQIPQPRTCLPPFVALDRRWRAPAALAVGNLGAVGGLTPGCRTQSPPT